MIKKEKMVQILLGVKMTFLVYITQSSTIQVKWTSIVVWKIRVLLFLKIKKSKKKKMNIVRKLKLIYNLTARFRPQKIMPKEKFSFLLNRVWLLRAIRFICLWLLPLLWMAFPKYYFLMLLMCKLLRTLLLMLHLLKKLFVF